RVRIGGKAYLIQRPERGLAGKILILLDTLDQPLHGKKKPEKYIHDMPVLLESMRTIYTDEKLVNGTKAVLFSQKAKSWARTIDVKQGLKKLMEHPDLPADVREFVKKVYYASPEFNLNDDAVKRARR